MAGLPERHMTPPIRGVLLDIEGTTTPLDFVHSVLFPYARAHVPTFFRRDPSSPEVQAILDQLARDRAAETAPNAPSWSEADPLSRRAAAVAYVFWLMDQDRKSTALKTLQGLVWREGYERGELKGVVFPDVPRAFARWSDRGLDVRIFSSGSVLAQRLLFSSCPEGDLTRFLRSFFDTSTGSKKDAASYRAIAEAFGLSPDRILFISDLVAELDAARMAGMATRLAVRPGNPAVEDDHGHRSISTFDEL